MNYHHLPYDEVLKKVDSRHDGLSEAEAADRLAQNGKNALIEAKKKPAIIKFLSQFTDPMIIVLLVAAVISAVLAIVRSEYTELIDKNTKGWDIDRVAFMDKTILLIAVAELLNFPTIPVNVTMNEYIELSKSYSSDKSPAFINGVLDNIVKDLTASNKLTKVKIVSNK